MRMFIALPAKFFTVGDVDDTGNVLIEKLVTNLAENLCRSRHFLQHLYKGLQGKLPLKIV